MYDFGFSRRFVLVRVWYLSSSEADTNNWGLFGKENYLTFDWWKQFLKILRRSEVTINLIRRLKKNGSKWVRPLVVLYSIFFFFFWTHLAPVEQILISSSMVCCGLNFSTQVSRSYIVYPWFRTEQQFDGCGSPMQI